MGEDHDAILEAMRIDKLQADELMVDVFKCALAHFQFASHATSRLSPRVAAVPVRPSLGRTHCANRSIASSASGARPAIIWNECSIPGNTFRRTSTPAAF